MGVPPPEPPLAFSSWPRVVTHAYYYITLPSTFLVLNHFIIAANFLQLLFPLFCAYFPLQTLQFY